MNAKHEFSANLVRRNLMRASREAKVESSESNFLGNNKLLVTMRLGETPVIHPEHDG